MFLLKIIFQNSVSTCIKNICPLSILLPFPFAFGGTGSLLYKVPIKKKLAERSGGEIFWNAKRFVRARTV